MKIIEVNNMYQAIAKIQQETRPAPVKFSYAVAINAKRIGEITEAFENSRKELVKKYGKLDDNGEPVVEGQQYVMRDQAAFEKDIVELQLTDVDLTLQKVKIDLFPDTIEPIIMSALMPMVDETE